MGVLKYALRFYHNENWYEKMLHFNYIKVFDHNDRNDEIDMVLPTGA